MSPHSLRILIALLAVTFVSVPGARSQTPQIPQPTPPPYTTFPLGGFDGYNGVADASTSNLNLPLFGLNCFWNAPVPLNQGLGTVIHGDNGGLGYFVPDGTNGRGYNPLFQQWDFDLVSNEKAADKAEWDLLFNTWASTGLPDVINTPRELLFAPTSHQDQDVYLNASGTTNRLHELRSNDPNAGIGVDANNADADDLIGGANVDYVDLISRLSDASSLLLDITTVYAIEATADVIQWQSTDNGKTWAHNPSVTVAPVGADVNNRVYITKGDYTHFRASNYSAAHFGNDYTTELPNILNFPNTQATQVASKAYSVFRLKFDVIAAGLHGNVTSGGIMYRTTIPTINFKLLGTLNSKGIYVRGVRIRSNWADDLYRGKFDHAQTAPDGLSLPSSQFSYPITKGLESIFSYMATRVSWQYTPALEIGNETNWPAYRAYAYIDAALYRTRKKHLLLKVVTGIGSSHNTIAGTHNPADNGNVTFYRSIYNDQTFTLGTSLVNPPPFQDEASDLSKGPQNYISTDHFPNPNGLIFAGDAIPSNLKNHSSFLEFGRSISGWKIPQQAAPGYYGFTKISGDADGDDYQTYTSRVQGPLKAMSRTNQSCAIQAYPQGKDPSTWGTFYAYPSNWEVTNEYPDHQYAATFDDTPMQHDWMGLIRDGKPFGFNSIWQDAATIEKLMMPQKQPPSITEVREQTWDALSWGAKGILYNYFGNDGAGNIGFCGTNFQQPQSGFSDLPNGDNTFPYYTLAMAPTEGFFFPPQTSTAQANADRETTGCFPDHEIGVPGGNGKFLWIPCLSDFTITAPDNSIPINIGDPISTRIITGNGYSVSLIEAYLNGVCNEKGWKADPCEAIKNTTTTNTRTGDWNTGEPYVSTLKKYYQWYETAHGDLTAEPNFSAWKPQGWGDSWPAAHHPDIDNKDASNPPGHLIPGDPNLDDATHIFSDWISGDRELDIFTNPPHRRHYLGAYQGYFGIPMAYPHGGGLIGMCAPTYYGFKDRSDGVKVSMADVSGIAPELNKLNWITAFDYSDIANLDQDPQSQVDHAWALTAVKNFPFANGVTSQRLQRYAYPFQPRTSRGDPSQPLQLPTDQSDAFGNQPEGGPNMLYQFGVFKDPDNISTYVTVGNKLTWPIMYDANHSILLQDPTSDPAHQYYYLGAIDARRVGFTLDNSPHGWVSQNWKTSPKYYSISDLRGKTLKKSTDNGSTWSDAEEEAVDRVVGTSMYAVDLEPGEGTLLGIAPALGLLAGRTSYEGMGYNNGHRVTEIIQNGDASVPRQRAMCWEKDGSMDLPRFHRHLNPVLALC